MQTLKPMLKSSDISRSLSQVRYVSIYKTYSVGVCVRYACLKFSTDPDDILNYRPSQFGMGFELSGWVVGRTSSKSQNDVMNFKATEEFLTLPQEMSWNLHLNQRNPVKHFLKARKRQFRWITIKVLKKTVWSILCVTEYEAITQGCNNTK